VNRACVGMAVLVLASGLQAGQDAAVKELKKMAGVWQATVLELDGRALEDAEKNKAKITVVVKDNRYTIYFDDKMTSSGLLKVDPAKSPKRIEALHLDGKHKGKVQPGIYMLDDREMKIVFAEPGTKNAPKEFRTGVGEVMIHYKRVK